MNPDGIDPVLAQVWDRLYGPGAVDMPPPPPPPRCTRSRSNGKPCGARAITCDWRSPWLNDIGTCGHHLTEAEQARRAEDRAAADLAYDLALDVPPHSWLWDRPDVVNAGHPATALVDWQAGRCAICGRETWLVEDHDHQSGMVRGLLCRRDNVHEGTNRDDGPHVYAYYRRRPPTATLGISYRYVNVVTGPDMGYTPPTDPWSDNVLRGLL